MPSPRMQLTGQPMVDAWRVQAFAGALRAAIAEGARSVLAIEHDALPIALALAGQHEGVEVTLVEVAPQRARRTVAVLGSLYGIEPTLLFAEPAKLELGRRFDVGVAYDPTSALQDTLAVEATEALAR